MFPTPTRSPLPDTLLAVHGGCGSLRRDNLTPQQDASCRDGLREALHRGGSVLLAGGSAVEAVCAAVCCLEDNPLFNAGRGAVLTFDGNVEMDAALMDGATAQAGAVAGVRTVKNPVLLARAVLEHSPFVLLAGTGAEDLAREQGIAEADAAYFSTPERLQQWQHWKEQWQAQQNTQTQLSEDGFKFGTVGTVARDQDGRLAAATSTGGMTGKRHGRIGDSPLIGAGTWASNLCAVSGTGHGEHFIRQAVAHDIHARMAYGKATLAEAAGSVIYDVLPAASAAGGVIALDAQGTACLPFNTPGMFRGVLHTDGSAAVAIYDDEALP